MTTRRFKPSDLPHILAMQGDFPYPDPADTEAMLVVADSYDNPVMACGARKLVELYLWSADATPATKLAALKLIQNAMTEELRKLGYSEAECFLPPAIEAKFGRRLMRSLGAVKNWASYCFRF